MHAAPDRTEPQGAACLGGCNAACLLTLAVPSALPNPAGMMAPDGRCKALDAGADGYVRSEAAVLILLQAASAASDSCSGQLNALLLCGTAVNQDGRSSSLTAPHGPSQQAVVAAAASAAGMAPGQLHAVEMHGTGETHGECGCY